MRARRTRPHETAPASRYEAYRGGTTALAMKLHTLLEEGWRGTLVYEMRTSMSLREAWDWHELCLRAKTFGLTLSGFSRRLDLAALLALCVADYRQCPPLAGPLVASAKFRHADVSEVLKRLGFQVEVVKMPQNKPSAVSFADSDLLNAEEVQNETALAAAISQAALTAVNRALNESIEVGQVVSTGIEALNKGWLTGVGYGPTWPERVLPRRSLQVPPGLNLGSVVRFASTARKGVGANTAALFVLSGWNLPGVTPLHARLAVLQSIDWRRFCGLLLVVDLDGGETSVADEFSAFIRRLTGRLPVAVYVHTAISAGYLACCEANLIVVNPLGKIGGVGAVGHRLVSTGMLKMTEVSAGRGESDTVRNHKILQRRVTIAAELFAATVRRARPLTPAGEAALKSGRLLGAEEACSVGLANQVGGLTTTVQAIQKLSGCQRIALQGTSLLRVGRLLTYQWRHSY